ncbi:UbiA family prenyltransferase [Tellurirhabdus rosea]|uniref:UbiA family prenyltransferase n=1 Tax=Tellurirhabdus rosea TaxID=2674997 RepID=UPI002257A162|nr:UbiA family prenyltransferase [Tellurirhabdus rosea]
MSPRALWLHLRVPFSFFLLPVFLFALSESPAPDAGRAVAVLLIIHLLLYPASNAYNSYFDKDEGSIGILENPPPVDKTLYYAAWALDLAALALGIWVGWPFVGYLLVYGLISKAYSHPSVRLKKYPIASWLIVSLFQGAFTFVMTMQALNAFSFAEAVRPHILLAGAVCTLNLLAIYPITQVYQHDEDARRGDLTMSRLLGIRGTFVSAVVCFGLSLAGFYTYFHGKPVFWLLPACLLPGVAFFLLWFRRVWGDTSQANFRSAMRMTLLAGLGLNIFFLMLFFLNFSESAKTALR